MTKAFALNSLALEHDVLQAIRANAGVADRGERTLAPDLAALHESGLLANLVAHTSVGGDALAGAQLLRRIGRVSLPVGRIVEGHANALRLIAVYGSDAQKRAADAAAAAGHIFGVWGADGKVPATIASRRGGEVVLQGAKQFCSGLGLLHQAVLPIETVDGPLLCLAKVDDTGRADASAWQVSGMRASASGRYDLDGLSAQILGEPGDFTREPHFEGGIWRYIALHCGGLEALADALRNQIVARGQQNDALQGERLVRLVTLAQTARLWVDAACQAVEKRGDAAAITQALLARQAVEEACLAGIAIAERALGTAAFASTGEPDRIRRDLAFFLRQANLDGKSAASLRHILQEPRSVGEMF